jgi:serine/threonine protein phosphatase PrpC
MDENAGPVISGSTVALCLVNLTKGVIVIGNVGDSHIFLARRDEGSEFITWQVRLTRLWLWVCCNDWYRNA